MDEEEFDTDKFVPGSSVLIETDDSIELGVIVSINYEGAFINSTHRMDIVGLITPKEKGILRQALEDTPTRMLRIFAREAGLSFVKCLILKREELIAICLEDAVETHNELGSGTAMVPLMKPIAQWVPRERVKKIMDSNDYMEEKMLRDLDFSIEGEIQ